ncbi:hypothetical protein A2U01_0100737, partial [Trifolium medium]|nr:hypothetical protein [Trifolium medium]
RTSPAPSSPRRHPPSSFSFTQSGSVVLLYASAVEAPQSRISPVAVKMLVPAPFPVSVGLLLRRPSAPVEKQRRPS